MNILILMCVFLFGAVFALVPHSRKISNFFDTVIHETGHALAALPFGSPLPSITVRTNTSGETLAETGRIHDLLPFKLGVLTSKLGRLLSLFFGYSAPIIFATMLMVLSLTQALNINSWILLGILFMALATLFWTGVKITDSPITFIVVFGLAIGVFLYFFEFSWITLGLLAIGIIVLFFLGKAFLALGAVLLTFAGLTSFIVSFVNPDSQWLNELFYSIGFEFTSHNIAKVLLTVLTVFVFICCRNFFALFLTLVLLVPFTLSIYQPFFDYSYFLAFFAAMLFASGIRSFLELYKINKKDMKDATGKPIHTDCMIAVEEFGGTPMGWYFAYLSIAIVSSLIVAIGGYMIALPL